MIAVRSATISAVPSWDQLLPYKFLPTREHDGMVPDATVCTVNTNLTKEMFGLRHMHGFDHSQ